MCSPVSIFRIIVPMRMPISEENMERRLKIISNQFRHLVNSTVTIGFFVPNRALGLISGTVRKHPETFNLGTLLHSNFAIFKENGFELFGNPVERIAAIVGISLKSCPIAIINVSYNGKMGIAITADKALFSGKDELITVINNVIYEINEIGKIKLQKEDA